MSTYSDDDLEVFFRSPDARRAALEEREERRREAEARPAAPTSAEDAELGSFFHSPDAPAGGDGVSGDGPPVGPPPGPTAPPRPTGPAAERRRRVGKALAVVLGVVGLGVALGTGVVVYLSQDLPSLETIENPQNKLATQVLSADGVELARYYDGENRTWVSLDEMSPYVPAALISTEDRRFYQHWGVDARGFVAVFAGLLRGEDIRGASTITMQLARNLYREEVEFTMGDRSVVRKAKEILTAVRIERIYTKREILEAYLNTVPFLYNAHGIEAASQTFYSTSASELAPGEAATLVGMLAANTYFDPVRNPENSTRRRNVVLANMLREGVIEPEAYETARAEPVDVSDTFDAYSHEDNPAPHFAEVLRLWFRDWAVANGYDPYRDGLVVHTTIDSEMQAIAAAAVAEQMDRLQGIVGRGWGSASNPFGYWWRRNTAVVDEYVRGTRRFVELKAAEDLSDAEAVARLRQNEAFMDSLKTARTFLEAGLVAVEPASGRVKAWVGGRDFVANKYDHVGQARRQPGSTFKLFAYAAAFNNGYAPQSGVSGGGFRWGDWMPKNSGGGYPGYMTLTSGLQHSVNTVAARITKHFGQAEVARTAYQMGIRTPLELPDENLDAVCREPYAAVRETGRRVNDCYARSIALGTTDVSLLEMAAAYATVANYGVYHGPSLEAERPSDPSVPPHVTLAVDRVEDRYGNVIQDFTPVAREVLNPSTAYTTYDALRQVVRAGTARGLTARFPAVRGLDLAGKTGTTQENADGWFIAVTPQLVVGSWTGFDDRRITYPSTAIGQGGRTGLMNVGAFLAGLQEGPESVRLDTDVEFERPEDYQPPTRRSRIGDAGNYWPTDGRRARSRSGGNGQNQEADRPAREILDRIREQNGAAEPEAQRSGSGGRIGW